MFKHPLDMFADPLSLLHVVINQALDLRTVEALIQGQLLKLITGGLMLVVKYEDAFNVLKHLAGLAGHGQQRRDSLLHSRVVCRVHYPKIVHNFTEHLLSVHLHQQPQHCVCAPFVDLLQLHA